MPLPFTAVCDLLESAHKLSVARENNAHVVVAWFKRNRDSIKAHDTNLAALLSTLLPDKRTDRVYCIQARSLEKIIGRAFFLGSSRIAELAQYRQPGLCVDLADCVARVLTITPNPALHEGQQVTVEEIDEILHSLAAGVKWSSPAIRASQSTLTPTTREDLEKLYRRFNAIEAKWFTRLVLKNYKPLVLDPPLVYRLCDPILPSVLKIHDDFTTAIHAVQATRGSHLSNSAGNMSREHLLGLIKPQLGIKVGRQQWLKGRSIKHCLDMGRGRMSVEDKIDGEYCQVHVDISKGDRCIQIFSKSGKDSTEDRVTLHGAIKESLRVGKLDTKIKTGCILEGELVVYDDSQHKILPFHKIRKHVARRGRFLNTEQDSLPGPNEHLMIIYYDILLLDNHSLINTRHSERFKILSDLIFCRTGWAELVHREVIDFNHSMGASNLRKAFARTILSRKEGLVLRADDPYFNFSDIQRPFSSSCIKLKKEYIGNFGDVGDFAVVGARYDAAKAREYRIPGLKWTHFYLGCLDNREQVRTWDAKPEFTVVNVVELNETMLRDVFFNAHHQSVPYTQNDYSILQLAPGVEQGAPMDVVFTTPLVFDLRCFSFDRVGNTGFWSLRFPNVTKVHFDRDFTDAVSFQQLQEMAKDATSAKELEDSQENFQWIAKLEAADPRGIGVDAVSQLTMTTMPTPSPRRSSQSSVVSWRGMSPVVTRRPATALEPQRAASIENPSHFPTKSVVSFSDSSQTDGNISVTQPKPKRVSYSVQLQPSKRQKPQKPAEQTKAMETSKQTQSPQIRTPFAEIDGNSQCDSLSQSAISRHDSQPKPEIIDLTSSPDISFKAAAVPVEMQPRQITREISQIEDATALKSVNNKEQQTDCEDQRSREFGETKTTHQSPQTEPAEIGQRDINISSNICEYAGDKCCLASYTILMNENITCNGTQIQSLLRQHGVLDATQSAGAWLQQEENGILGNEVSESKKPVIWLVDTIDEREKTKSELRLVNERRESLRKGKRKWITVYDWRVLSNLKTMEDETIKQKYYDGWHDPWRRWYCGIV
ncbi:hypothetical protein BGZ63DRAFT_385740 [Mariannaea sp. PMI_226]|nr:hypothetical protein BGZ63DRAFT_385740 [Mariannaea sp. PMI_226]